MKTLRNLLIASALLASSVSAQSPWNQQTIDNYTVLTASTPNGLVVLFNYNGFGNPLACPSSIRVVGRWSTTNPATNPPVTVQSEDTQKVECLGGLSTFLLLKQPTNSGPIVTVELYFMQVVTNKTIAP
jgi:hypothetical protein